MFPFITVCEYIYIIKFEKMFFFSIRINNKYLVFRESLVQYLEVGLGGVRGIVRDLHGKGVSGATVEVHKEENNRDVIGTYVVGEGGGGGGGGTSRGLN